MARTKIFISHVHEDADLAVNLKGLIEDSVSGAIEVFVSSAPQSLALGVDWFQTIRENIQNANGFIILLTPDSLNRPWVNFEAGAAFGRDVRLVPVCTRGLKVRHVAAPLSTRQILEVHTEDDIRRLVQELAHPYGYTPKIDQSRMQAVAGLILPSNLPPPLTPEAKLREPAKLAQMRAEWDDLGQARHFFWTNLGPYYSSHFRGRAGFPNTIEDLVDVVSPPVGLPLSPSEHLRDYPGNYGRQLQGSDLLLYDFARAVYPSKDPSRSLKECSAIPDAFFDDFHQARGDLSRFWNRWGQAAYELHEIGLNTIKSNFVHHRLIKILSYLEIALVQWERGAGGGKRWLFALGRDWERITT
jgi:TIR domain